MLLVQRIPAGYHDQFQQPNCQVFAMVVVVVRSNDVLTIMPKR
jgi:hypothetical protein